MEIADYLGYSLAYSLFFLNIFTQVLWHLSGKGAFSSLKHSPYSHNPTGGSHRNITL